MEPAPDYPAAAAITSRASQQLALPPGKAGSGDNFAIDDLLDFSNEDEDGSLGDHLGGWSSPLDAASGNSTDSSTATTTVTHDNHENNNTSAVGSGAGGGLDCTSGGDQYVGDNAIADLCVPYEDLADLEWLSHLEEEPFSTEDIQKLQLISGSGALKSAVASSSDAHSELSTNTTGSVTTAGAGSTSAKPLRPPMAEADETPMLPPLFLPEAPVRGARSKRSRAAAPGNWTSRLLLLTSSAARASSPESELLLVPPSHTHLEQYSPPLKKAQKPAKKKESHANHEGLGGLAALTGLAPSPDGRKCLHCQTDKTPQWRTGPMGPKTLCNACGVRYKSGRLVPEYRPAASPTFIQSKHSNSHRKVMELRRQKEMIHHQHLIHQQPLPQHQHHQQNNYYEHRLHGGTSPYLPHPNGFYDGDDFVIHRHVGPDFRQLI